ncbi:hypothetical protein BDB00DRAFT_2883 [Zychaea mexicana]|uniref:uncharacterized protein n=1 Tax=Zychaea mexicana TaxID=64656 RepID=UPI0022FF1CF3|nr:uncharacterized protein BDB00DRAFT_2883 [Zychaea mexicana]KAI9499485.1 hypothetical protein BDB00DRAFT_2883 [Zychaea mexicana]
MRSKLHRHHHHHHKHDNNVINDDHTQQIAPAVTISPSQPLLPRSPSEQQEFDELNQVDSKDEAVPQATITHPQPDQNRLSPLMRNKTPTVLSSSSSSDEDEGETSSASLSSASQIDMLSKELKEHQHELQEVDKEEDLIVDKQLLKTTERNRHIPSPEPVSNRLNSTASSSSSSTQRFHRRLVFTEPIGNEQADRVTLSQYYGQSTPEQKPHRKPRVYLVASDFSKESRSAMEWTMGTMLRDHDEIHVVTVVSQEQDLAELDMTPAKVLQGVSKTLNARAKQLLSHMLLFNVKLVTVATRGHVREVLHNLINELPVTMVVCGCRGRSTMKGMLMGSVSTYLLHKAPVPVSVIRYHKKRKHKSKRKSAAHAAALSESMKAGHLVVDELGAAR